MQTDGKNISAEKASEKESSRFQKKNADFFRQKSNRKKKTERQKEVVSIVDTCFVAFVTFGVACSLILNGVDKARSSRQMPYAFCLFC